MFRWKLRERESGLMDCFIKALRNCVFIYLSCQKGPCKEKLKEIPSGIQLAILADSDLYTPDNHVALVVGRFSNARTQQKHT